MKLHSLVSQGEASAVSLVHRLPGWGGGAAVDSRGVYWAPWKQPGVPPRGTRVSAPSLLRLRNFSYVRVARCLFLRVHPVPGTCGPQCSGRDGRWVLELDNRRPDGTGTETTEVKGTMSTPLNYLSVPTLGRSRYTFR